DAIVYAWHPGTSGGRCVADVLFGDENPSGKLPVSFPRSVGHIPAHYNHMSTGRPTDPYDRSSPQRYRNSMDSPLYPFGYGLSYTQFSYAKLQLAKASIASGEKAKISLEITNTGARTGEEIAQLYVRDEVSRFSRPVRELKGFAKVQLQPGESQTVTFELGPEELGYFSPQGEWLLETGDFTIFCGGDSTCTLSTTLTLTASA
ncbi:MAG: fibronectin type III-like domain-contianing protein, partial [Puniceicoccales bacterium]